MRFALRSTWLGLRCSRTRIPFRYGSACLEACPQAILEAVVETADGQVSAGYSGDCLPPGWFDKTPGLSYARQIDDMLAAAGVACAAWGAVADRGVGFFAAWREADRVIHHEAQRRGWPHLLASFGFSLVERAVMDALARGAGLSLHQALVRNLYGIEPGDVHPELAGAAPSLWLSRPLEQIQVRLTVGLGDALTEAEIPPGERLADGLPQSVEDHITRNGVSHFKVKLRNQLDTDLERLRAFARLVERYRGLAYALTLDGNEQYHSYAEFSAFLEGLEAEPALEALRRNVLAIEQPLDRHVALEPEHAGGIAACAGRYAVLIDESDATLDSFRRAAALGYRGVSSKNCKGAIKSLLNLGLIRLVLNRRHEGAGCLLTGEDLCTVGVVPVQSDLCLAAALGITHVERNGHHYHPGLSYLPRDYQRAALAAHPDFYGESNGIITPVVRAGGFTIGSLQCPGYGFIPLPRRADYTPANEWTHAALGL